MATRVQGGGTRTVAARPPREGCGCKPDPVTGCCCASMRCSCHKNGEACSESCACAGLPGEAPLCDCAEPKRCVTLAVKKAGENKGRRFFKCQDCDFFKWAGERGACANPNTNGVAEDLDRPAKRPRPNGSHGGMFDNVIDLDDGTLDGGSERRSGPRGRGSDGGAGGSSPSAPRSSGHAGRTGRGRGGGGKGGGGNGGRKKKPCAKGPGCPYQHELQHCAEYSHPGDEPAATAGSGFTAFGGGGQRLGGSGGGGTSGTSSGFGIGGSVLGGGGGSGGDEGVKCEVCGRVVSLVTFDLHSSAHERSGELARWQQQQQQRALVAEQEAAYEASLRADQEAEAAEEVRRAQEARARAAAKAKAKVEAEAAEAAAEAAKREERRQRDQAEARRALRQRAEEALPPEPAAVEGGPPLTMLKVRLPDGTAVVRRFQRTETAAALFAWLMAQEALEALPAWSLALPAGALPLEGGLLPTEETLEELDLINVTLWVQQEE